MKLKTLVACVFLSVGVVMSVSCSKSIQCQRDLHVTEGAMKWFAQLEECFEAFRKPLVLDSWNEAVGKPTMDTQAFEDLRETFFVDQSVDERLREFAKATDEEVAVLAKAWLAFREGRGLSGRGEIGAINDEIDDIATGGSKAPGRMAALQTLYASSDPDARQDALESLAERMSEELIPLLERRAVMLNERARQLGYPNYLATHAGLPNDNPLKGLEKTCDEQIQATADGWDGLVRYARKALGREPEHADYLALAVQWTTETSQFLHPKDFSALANEAFGRMGFDVESLGIEVQLTPEKPGGAAYAISIPDDVRFHGNFPPGFEGARGWFHELGHAVHMTMVRDQPQPLRRLPEDRALNEGIGEVFARVLREPEWLRERFPELSSGEIQRYLESVAGFDAYAIREYCLLARSEATIHMEQDIRHAFSTLYRETFGRGYSGKPFYDLVPYIKTPLYSLDYVVSVTVTRLFLKRLGKQPLLTPSAGQFLRETLLEPGNQSSLEAYLADSRRLVP